MSFTKINEIETERKDELDEMNHQRILDYKITSYQESDLETVENMLDDAGEFVKTDIMRCIKKYPQNGLIIKSNGNPIAVSVHLGVQGRKKCSFTLYVHTKARRQGIGTTLLEQTICSIRNLGIESVITDYGREDSISSFLQMKGFSFWFVSNHMIYKDGLLEESNVSVIPYEDKYYDEFYELESRAFYELRKANNVTPYLFESSAESRKECADNAKDYYLVFKDDVLIAAGYAGEGEVDHIAVNEEYRGQGYGRAVTVHGVNKLLREGDSKVSLWVLDWNKSAIALYKSIGFKIERAHEFWFKDIR